MHSRTVCIIMHVGLQENYKKLIGRGSTGFFLSVAMASAKPAVMEQDIFRQIFRCCLKCINSKRFIFYGHAFYEYLIYIVCQHQTMTNES